MPSGQCPSRNALQYGRLASRPKRYSRLRKSEKAKLYCGGVVWNDPDGRWAGSTAAGVEPLSTETAITDIPADEDPKQQVLVLTVARIQSVPHNRCRNDEVSGRSLYLAHERPPEQVWQDEMPRFDEDQPARQEVERRVWVPRVGTMGDVLV